MKRYLKHIFLSLTLCVLAASCMEELDSPQPAPGSDALTLVPRVTSFANRYVTKAGYGTDETKITSLAVLVFNEDDDLVHIQEGSNTDGISTLTLNKSMLNSPEQDGKLDNATLVMIANAGLDTIKDADGKSISDNRPDLTLDGLNDYTFHFEEGQTVVTSLGDGFTGFPMIGTATADLTPTSTSSVQKPIEVHLQILYAKVNFSITVAEGSENQNLVDPEFTLSRYTVNNVSKRTSYAAPAEGAATASDEYAYTDSGFSENTVGTAVLRDTVKFTFYVAESRYKHRSDLKGIYPDDSWLTSEHYDEYKQQYKPKIAEVPTGMPGTGLATYVTLSGTYKDYRGTAWTVSYDVYLGKDNSQNFEVDRNSEYTNIITIKGIRNRQEGSYGNGEVWIDHRVDVKTDDLAGNVTITRETLIDSHIEVRPLRVKWPEGAYAGVRVYLPTNSDGSLINWIGIERFTGENCQEATTYCYNSQNISTGKRRYFTTTLISELQTMDGEFGVNTDEDTGRKYIYLLNGECAWIYFDENTSTSVDRSASIELEFYTDDGSKSSEVYNVTQKKLQSLGGYAIESYEEYLHSYDSDDKYNLSTSPVDYTQQGFAWGVENKTLSKDIIVSATSLENFQNYVDARYDYFHESDVPANETYYTYTNDGASWVKANYGTGLIFTDRAAEKEGITVKDMGTKPDNAYQYCLSKNKFTEDENGDIKMDIHWYLPDVYELRTVLQANQTDGNSSDFSDDSYYWSSQPTIGGTSITIFGREVSIKEEDVANSRAVSITETKDLPRSTQNRIRCFYDATGITANMTGRAPDGVGGNFSFVMKAYSDKSKSAIAYYNYMLEGVQSVPESSKVDYQYDNSSYPYPTFANPGNEFGYFSNVVDDANNSVSGFSKDPAQQTNWSPYQLNKDYYYTLATYSGLSEYTLEKARLADAYRPTDTKKSDTKVEISKEIKKLQADIASVSLYTLDHLTGGSMLNISFGRGNNTSYSPKYDYEECTSGSEVTTTRYWQVPTYSEKTYTPKAESNTKTYTGTGTGTGYGSKYRGDKGKSQAQSAARDAALEDAKNQAHTEFPNCTYTYGTESYVDTDEGYTEGRFGLTTYTMKATCTIVITSTATSTPVTYYADASNGGWDSGTPVPKSLVGISTDEMIMYCGNSFTISLADDYKDDYEISKVKVYYSGSNFIKEVANGGALGSLFPGLVGTDKIYTRFVDSTIDLPQSITLPKGGSSEGLQLLGMDYNDDLSSGEGSHQWTGAGRESVTLVLVDYFLNDDASNNSYTYKYDTASTDFTKYIVIDKIEVKCTKRVADTQ